MTSVSTRHIMLTPTQTEGSGRLGRGSNARPPKGQRSTARLYRLSYPPATHTHKNDRQKDIMRAITKINESKGKDRLTIGQGDTMAVK